MAERLPIYDIQRPLLAALRQDPRLIVSAPTGSGKSTQIPQMLLDHGLLGAGQVVILQPRRLATRLLAARVASERNTPLGREVGSPAAAFFPASTGIIGWRLPIAEMEAYVGEVMTRLEREWPAYRRLVFGHLGDGNLHIIAAGPPSQEARHGIERCVYEPLAARSGSVSAEHGIGLEKQPWLAQCRSPAELALMRQLKQTLDPRGILNPGRVLP